MSTVTPSSPGSMSGQGYSSSKLNSQLGQILPVVYGALLSYAMYSIATFALDAMSVYKSGSMQLTDWLNFNVPSFALMIVFLYFVIQDVGEITKLSARCPFKGVSRYFVDLAIACFYLAAFAAISRRSLLSILFFGLAIATGGLWCHVLSREYTVDDEEMSAFASTLRTLHWIGGGIFLIESAFFMFRGSEIQWHITICVLTTFILWMFVLGLLAVLIHGEHASDYMVNIVFPRPLVRTLTRRRALNGK